MTFAQKLIVISNRTDCAVCAICLQSLYSSNNKPCVYRTLYKVLVPSPPPTNDILFNQAIDCCALVRTFIRLVLSCFGIWQVSTNTGIISRKVQLKVVTPEAFILGGDEYHIDRGSQISLVCVIEKAPSPPQ